MPIGSLPVGILSTSRFLPALLACKGWRISAIIQTPWKTKARLELDDRDGFKSHLPPAEEFDSTVEEAFRRRYLEGRVSPEEEDSEDGGDEARWRLRAKPCPFLKDNRCTVYDARPEQCRKYPYLYEPNFSFRTLGMIERTFTCPVVYRVFEELKAELPFRQQSHRWESW